MGETTLNDELEKHHLNLVTASLVTSGLLISDLPVIQKCPCCEIEGVVTKRRLNTAYVHEESNWMTSCERCFQDTVEHFADLWASIHQ
jgi:hypothetical protein